MGLGALLTFLVRDSEELGVSGFSSDIDEAGSGVFWFKPSYGSANLIREYVVSNQRSSNI